MKKLALLLFALLLWGLGAHALGEGHIAAFEAAHPGYAIEAQEVCGGTAATVMAGEGRRILLVAEKENGAWRIVIDNPNALEQDSGCPRLLLDSDIALFWSYTQGREHREYSAVRGQGTWGSVSLRKIYTHDGGIWETIYTCKGDRLDIEYLTEDENENILTRESHTGLEGAGLEEAMRLEHFELNRLSLPLGWATPNNPNPADRLHLRAEANRGAVSLGKYYNGTPVKALWHEGDFTRVNICGVDGYMMTSFLAVGKAMDSVSWAANAYELRDHEANLYDEPNGSVIAVISASPTVIGVVGETWFHVYFPDTGLSGYVRQEALWPENK